MTERIEAARDYIRTNFGAIPEPEKSCIVFSGPRSGSNLLLRHLEEIGYGKPIEAFHWNPDRLRREQGWEINFDDPFEYITHAVQFQTVNNICGAKLGWLQFTHFISLAQQLFKEYSETLTAWELIEVFFPNPTYLHLMRKSKVKQAVSLAKSKQTGVWYVSAEDSGEYKDYIVSPVYDRELIDLCFGEVLSIDVQWITFLEAEKVPHLTIWYEDYIANFESEMRRINAYLGGTADLKIPDLPLKKLADKKSADWYQRFEEETNWIKEPLVQKALQQQEFPLLLSYYSYFWTTKMENEYFAKMPATRFRKLRKLGIRIQNKLKKIMRQ